mgnify:CR=1 FL=1
MNGNTEAQANISPNYPLNFLLAVDNKYKTDYIPSDIDETIEYLLHIIFANTPNDADILRKHFKYGKTYADIACEYQDTEEHIQQLANRAIGKFQYPTCVDCLGKGIFKIIMYYRGFYRGFYGKFSCSNKAPDFVTTVTEIGTLNLSVRSENGLRRAGINTIGDLEKMTTKELLGIRNLGKRSYDEIVSMLRLYNIGLRDEE